MITRLFWYKKLKYILKFVLGSGAWGNRAKEVILRLSNEQYIFFVFFFCVFFFALSLGTKYESMNFNISNMVY